MTRPVLYYRFFYIFEYADGSPPTVTADEGCVGGMLSRLPNCREMTKKQLLQWLEYEEGFKPFTDTYVINGKGKYSACHAKAVDAWIVEEKEAPLLPNEEPIEEGESFGTR